MSSRAPILLAVHSARIGGAQLMALAAAEHLAQRHELHIAVPRGPLTERFAQHGRLVRGSPTMPFSWGTPARWAGQLARAQLDALRIAAYIRRHRIAAVYVNSLVVPGPVLGARLAGVPAIVHARELPADARDRALVALQSHAATTVIAISEAVRRAIGTSAGRVALVPDGIAIPDEAPAPSALGAPLRLCLIGTIDPDGRKGQDVAIDAVHRLARASVPASLRLVGPVSDPAAAAALRDRADRLGVGDRVVLTGATDRVSELIADSDVVLSCAREEPLGLTVIEALARERPVVATRVGGVVDIVRDRETGLLVDPDAPQAVADAIAGLASDPDGARAMARRGRSDVSARFERAAQLRALQDELDRLL